MLVGVTVLALVATVTLLRSGGDAEVVDPGPATSTSAPQETRPARLPVVHLVAHTDDGPRPATTAEGPGAGGGDPFEAIQATPVVTEGRVVVLVDGGTVVAGRPGGTFRRVGPDVPSSAIVASNEPGHVWVVAPDDDLVLVDLDGRETLVRIPLEGDRVLGPASFGVVTRSPGGAVSWRRPSFDATPLAIPSDRVAVDAGGDVVLVERSERVGGVRQFEAWSVVEGRLLQGFAVSGERAAVLATDGSTAALPQSVGWIVRDVATGEQRGSLPASFGDPVWIGDGRFAVQVDGRAAASDGTVLAPRWRIWALAEQSP